LLLLVGPFTFVFMPQYLVGLFFGVLAAGAFAFSEDTSHDDPAGSLTRTSSYAYLLLHSPSTPSVFRPLSAECTQAIKKVYASGHTLYSQKLHDAATPVGDWTYFSGKKTKADFYHWTKDTATLQMAATGNYDGIFKSDRTTADEFWHSVWYVAEDTKSSSYYGNKMVTLTFLPDAKVLSFLAAQWDDAIAEINQQYPDVGTSCHLPSLQAPGITLYDKYKNYPFFVIAEDSGIDLIDYYGVGIDKPHRWFQVVSPAHLAGYRPVRPPKIALSVRPVK
jgi:hypothetical protein